MSVDGEARATAGAPGSLRGSDIRLFYAPEGRLRLQVRDECCFLAVRAYRVAPLSQPNGPVAFLDGKGYEICTLRSLDELDPDSRRIAETEIALRYLTSRVQRVKSLLQEAGATYWTVETDRGERDLVIQGLQENCVWLSSDQLMLIDVDGNRFEVPSIAALDERSRALLHQVL